MNKLAILGFPRSSTKLLASVHEQNGYFNFGEFFDTFSSDIDTAGIPFAKRYSTEDQFKFRATRNSSLFATNYKQHTETKRRIDLYKQHADIKSIITIWPENFELTPELFEILSDRYFLCTRRANKFEQLLSRLATHYNLNYNNEVESKPFTAELRTFELFYFNLKKVENLQDYIINSGRGRVVDFDKLISGNEELGFSYNVTSEDQHSNLYDLVKNLDEIKNKFESLNKETS
jgi:hypothetical protein